MADISINGLYKAMQNQFKAGGVTRFDTDFVTCVNRGIARINRQADLETRIPSINDTTGTISLDETYEDVLADLTSLNLMKAGQRPSKGMEDFVSLYAAGLDDRIDDIRQDILNQAVDADTDDETDFVGLGALNE